MAENDVVGGPYSFPRAQAVARGTLVQLAGRAGGTVVSLATAALVAHAVGTARYGLFSLAVLVGSIAATVGDLGLSAVAVRELTLGGIEDAWAYARLKTMVQLVVFVAAGVVVSIPHVVPGDVRQASLLAVLGAAFTSVSSSFQLVYQVRMQWGTPVVSDLIGRVLSLVLVVVLVEEKAGITGLVAAAVAGNALAAAVLATHYVRRGYPLRGRLAPAAARAYLVRSFLLGGVLVLGFLHFKVDSVIIAAARPSSDLGIYSAAYRFVEYALLLPALFLQSAFPALVEARAAGQEPYRRAVQKAFDLVTTTGIGVATCLGVAATVLTDWFGGGAFRAAATPLRLLAVALAFAWINGLFAQLSIAAGLQRLVLWVSALAVLLNVGANLLVIPRYGYIGASITTIGSEGAGALFVAAVVIRSEELRFHWRRPMLATVVAAAAAAVYWLSGALRLQETLHAGLSLAVLCIPLVVILRGSRLSS